MQNKIHEGRNIKRFREMLGIKQEALASELGDDWNQRKISLLEQKEMVEPELLQQISSVLKIPVEAFQNFDEEQAINIISNTFHDFKDNAIASAMNYQCSFNPIDKIVEIYEKLVASEKEKVELLKKMIEK